MASRRRTQEEKNLKTLRELASLPANKQCFDCRQRGPTYINVTIGSFVCTSCSGILRGLNPPHRVKSITMTTFSLEEIEFIKSRGNEYCQYVWMGLYDSRALEPESRDEQKTRDFMIQKYERKRWYVDPDIAMKKIQQDHQRQFTLPSSSSQGSLVPETKPLSTLLGSSAANLVVQHNPGNSNSTWPPAVTSSTAHHSSLQTQAKGKFELNDFDGNTFNNSKSSADSLTANGNFANFESAFNTPALTTAQSNFHQRKACTPPAGWTSFDDDLDPLHSTSSLTTTSSSFHRQPSILPPLPTKLPSTSTTNSTAMPRPLSLPTFSPTNPFSSPSNKLSESSTPSQWPSFPVSTVAAVHPITTGAIQTNSTTSTLPVYSSAPKGNINSKMSVSQVTQPPTADRYAALADLDTMFHQNQIPVTSSSSWATTESDMFGNNTSDTAGNFTSDIASNPFSSESLGWNKPVAAHPQKIYSTANPFQSVIPTSGVSTQPNSVFGVAHAIEDGFTSFTGNANFPSFPLNNMTNSLNGIAPNQYGTQNGGFGIRPSVMMWGTNQGTWGSNVVNNQTIAQTAFQETKLEQTGSHWLQQNMPAAANPFLDRNGSTAPRTNPSNPFL